jgi:predicted metal-dependent hydrolase
MRLFRRRRRIRRRVVQWAALTGAAFPPTQLDLPATGCTWRLVWHEGPAPFVVETTEDFIVYIRGPLQDVKTLRQVLLNWLKKQALIVIGAQLQDLSQRLGLPYQRISVRWQRSRWGSCSSRGTISLNGALLFQEPGVVNYLLIHELTHLRHMNHSAAFWKTVAQHCPDYRQQHQILKTAWQRIPEWVLL